MLCALPPLMFGNDGNLGKKDFTCEDHGPMAMTTILASMISLSTFTPTKIHFLIYSLALKEKQRIFYYI